MKPLAGRAALIFALSIALWVALYLTSSPTTPPGGAETVGLLVVVGLLVTAGDWVINRLRKGRNRHD